MANTRITPQSRFEDEVRCAAADLWLASRLVSDPEKRGRLVALYAVHVELSKVAVAASNPLAGELRLAWWRDEAVAMGRRTLGHPALQVLAGADSLDKSALDAMIEARHAELEERPFADEAALIAYLDGVDGGVMRAAASLLGYSGDGLDQAGRAVGWARLSVERAAWRQRGRDWTPLAWGEATDVEVDAHVRHRVGDALRQARGQTARLPVSAFPAVAYVSLAGDYANGRAPSDLEKRLRMLWAAIKGAI